VLGRGQGLTIDVDHQDRLLVEGERVRILLPVCRLVPVSCISLAEDTEARREPGLLAGWGCVKGGWLSKWSRPWLTSTPSTPESLLAELLPPFLNVDSDCQELSPKFPFPQRLTLGAGPSPLPPLFLFLDTLIHFQTIGVPDTQTGASEDIMARLTKVESHQGSDTWATSAQRYLF